MEAQPPQPYNLIFMDVQMPNLNGLDSTRLIRQTGFSAPIVALSAYSEDTNIKECLASGMNDFIAKPIRRPRLKQVLKTFCSPIPEEKEEENGELKHGRKQKEPEQSQTSSMPKEPPPTGVGGGQSGERPRPESPISPMS